MNSDSTCTCDQAQSSSSDAAAEQQRQEIESLKAEAAQVPCGASSFCSPLCIVFLLSWLLEKLSSQTHIQVQCDPTRYSSSKKSLLKLRRRKYHTMLVGLQRRERIDWIDDLMFFCRFPCKDQKSSIAASAEQQRQEIESLREQSLEVRAFVLPN